jgi:hypothetical protein
MKNILLAVFVVLLLAGCSWFAPEPTPTPTPTIPGVPTPTPYPEKWRQAEVVFEHAFYEKTGEYNDAGYPFFVPAHVGKAKVGEVYWCDWPIQGDGQKFCKIVLGEFEGYFLRVNRIVWLGN